MVPDLNLFGSVGDLYCFSNTLSMLVISESEPIDVHLCEVGAKFSFIQIIMSVAFFKILPENW